MRRILFQITRFFHNLRRGVSIAKGARIHPAAVLSLQQGGTIQIGEGTEIHSGAILATYGGSIAIGSGSSVNPYCVLYGHGGLTIGNDVRIATHTVIIPSNHTFARHDVPIRRQPLSMLGVTIKDNVWIAAGVTVLDGVTIESGCVVGAGSLVRRSLAANGVYVGVPARRVKSR